jgi:hypothetical protein
LISSFASTPGTAFRIFGIEPSQTLDFSGR